MLGIFLTASEKVQILKKTRELLIWHTGLYGRRPSVRGAISSAMENLGFRFSRVGGKRELSITAEIVDALDMRRSHLQDSLTAVEATTEWMTTPTEQLPELCLSPVSRR
ncbi:MAG: hypothetical protein RLZZ416_354 [Candidatus Parcubacteria bacterium]